MPPIKKTLPILGTTLDAVLYKGKPFIIWTSVLGKEALGGIPSDVSLPVISSNFSDGLKSVTKVEGLRGSPWALDCNDLLIILKARSPVNMKEIEKELVHRCLDFYKDSLNPDSAGQPSSPPQVKEQSQGDEISPEVKDIIDNINMAMEQWQIDTNLAFDDRIKDLEMVKYQDQLGDMAERISNMEEKLHEYEAKMRDFHLLVRSLKEATGSQEQTKIIGDLVGMIKEDRNNSV